MMMITRRLTELLFAVAVGVCLVSIHAAYAGDFFFPPNPVSYTSPSEPVAPPQPI
jgi:hypothetical protein